MALRTTFGILAAAAAISFGQAQTVPQLNNAEREHFLRTARVVNKVGLSMGVTQSQKATLDDGALQHAAHVQTVDERRMHFETARGAEINFRDSYKFNVAAYELAKLLELDMIPPSIERRVGGSTAAVTWWVDDVAMTELDRRKKKQEPPDAVAWRRQLDVMYTFDQLIFNTDRNLGNMVITKDWRLWMIDHTRAFRLSHKCKALDPLRRTDRKLLESLRTLDAEQAYARLQPWLTKPEIEGLLRRRDQIVQHFDRAISDRGESEVLFDLGRL